MVLIRRSITLDGYKRASIGFEAWGRSVTVTPIADFQEYQQTTTKKETLENKIRSDIPLRFSVPKECISWELNAMLLTEKKLSLRKGEVGNTDVSPLRRLLPETVSIFHSTSGTPSKQSELSVSRPETT
jgi:hypothetical protein